MFSGRSFFRRGVQGKRQRLRHERRQRPRKLRLERLEDRRLLATFNESGSAPAATLNLVLGLGESLSIQSTSSGTYTFTLTAGGPWSGTDTANVVRDGTNTNLLTVTSAGKAAFATVSITDSAATAGVVFADSGTSAYSESFTIGLDTSPSGTITFNGTSNFGTFDISATTTANILVSSGASLSTTGGGISLNASTSQHQNLGTISAGNGSVTITANSIDIQNPITANGGITLQPATLTRTIGLQATAGDFNLTATELGHLASTGTVTVGAAGGTGAIGIGGTTDLNLGAAGFDLALRGGPLTFVQKLTAPSGKTLTLRTGAVTSAPGTVVDIEAGTLWLDTQGAVGTSNNPLWGSLTNLRGTVGGDFFIRESDQVTIADPLSAGANTIHLVTGGQFNLGASDVIDDSTRIRVNGSTLNLNTWKDTVGGVTLMSSGTISGSGTLPANGRLTSTTTFQVESGVISAKLDGAVGLNKTTSGMVTLSGDNTYTGATTIAAGGILSINKDTCLGTPPSTFTPGHLELRGILEATESFDLAANRGIVLGDPAGSGAGAIRVSNARTLVVRGRIADNGSGADSLTKQGLGTLVLAGDNTYSGGTDYAIASVIRIDHANGLGTGPLRFTTSGTLRFGLDITTDLPSRIASWATNITATIDTNGHSVVFTTPLTANGRLDKVGAGKLTLAATATDTTQVRLLYVDGGELAVASGILQVTGSAAPAGTDYTGLTSLFVKNATLTIAGGKVVTEKSLLINYGAGLNGTLNVTSGTLEVGTLDVPGDLVAGANRLATVDISGDSTTQVIVKGDFIVGLKGSSTVNISGATTQIEGRLIAGKDGSGTVNVSGGTVNATSLRHLGGDDGFVTLRGGIIEVDEVVLETANNTSNDSLTIYLDEGGTLITNRMYLDWTGGTQLNSTHTFAVQFDGGTLQPKLDGNLIDAFTGQNRFWQGVLEDGGTLKEGAAIIDTNGFDVNVLESLSHDPTLVGVRDGGLTKRGEGTLTLSADNTFTGPVTVEGGTVALVSTTSNNIISGANFIDVQYGTILDVTGLDYGSVTDTLILASGQTLQGTGMIKGNLIADSGSTVAPGSPPDAESDGSPGRLLQEGDYTMNANSSLNIKIGGNTPGNEVTNYSQIDVTGAVHLDNATLNLAAFNGYVPQLGDEYMIIKNGPVDDPDAVIGTFAGLPEGHVFTTNFLNSGLYARISYEDGDGNDVVISTFLPAEIGDLVWVDLNGDGIQDQNEPGFEGITVSLTGTDAWGNPASKTTTTGSNGSYRFNGPTMLPGTYTVTVSNPGGYSFSPQYQQGGNGSLDSDVDASGVTAPVTVASNQSNLTIDAGLVPLATGISLDKSGVFDAGADGDAQPGELIAYTFSVTNPGNVTLRNVELSDPLLGTISYASGDADSDNQLDVGETWIYTASYALTQEDIDAGEVNNLATVTAVTPQNGSVQAQDDHTQPLPQNPRIGLQTTSTFDAGGDGYADVGELVNYTFTVTNAGNVTLRNVELSDPLLGTISYASGDTDSDDQLDVGETWIYTASYAVTQADIDAGKVNNVATVTAVTPQNGSVQAEDAHTQLLPQNAMLNLDNSGVFDAGTDGYAQPSELITYTFLVTNTGNLTLHNVVVSDPLPGLSAIIPATVASLAPGGMATYTATYAVTQADIDVGWVYNLATADSDESVPATDDNTEPLPQNAQLELDKSGVFDGGADGYAQPGEQISYRFLVTNTGNVTLHNVTVSDPLPGLSPISPARVASLAPGETATFTATYAVTQPDIDLGSVSNIATGNSNESGPARDGHTQVLRQYALLNLDKTGLFGAGADGYAQPGELIEYTFVVVNTSNVTLHNVTVSDPLPGLSAIHPVNVASLPPGDVTTFTASYTVTQADIDLGWVSNVATAESDESGPARDADTQSLPRIALLSLDNSGVFDAGADGYAQPGELISYTFVVTNTGNVTLHNVLVSDPLPGLSPISPANVAGLAPGGTATFTATYAVTQADIDVGWVYNVATADSDESGPATDDNTEPLPQHALLKLDKRGVFDAGADGHAQPGELIAYTFVATNTGNVTLHHVLVSDPLPGLSPINPANVASLAPGGTAVFTATYAVTRADIGLGSVHNLATARSDESAPATDNDIVPLPRTPVIVLGPDKNPGTLQEVRVVDGDHGAVLSRFVAYENYVGGTRVALVDLDGDGIDEIITAPGRNHVPQIRIFTLEGEAVPGFPSFLAYSPTFINGVQLAVGYVNDDDLPDLITVPSYGAAEVRIFLNGYDKSDPTHSIPAFSADRYITFEAFPVASIGGAVVAAGDMGSFENGSFVDQPDGRAEVFVGTGAGTTATVAVFEVSGAAPVQVATFVPFAVASPGFLGGFTLDVAPIDNGPIPAVIVGMGVNGTSRIEIWTWDPSAARLTLLGAIPKAFTGSSSNAAVSVAAADTNGDGIADAIFAVQGPIGTTGQIRRFDINGTSPLEFEQPLSLAGFTGPWFVAASKSVLSSPASIVSSPVSTWTNLVNRFDVNNDGLVTPLDVLETINYINLRPGDTALPVQQFSRPRFFDTNADAVITPADVLVVLNYLNGRLAGSGEGEASEPAEEIAAMSCPWNFAASPAMPRSASSTPETGRDRVLGASDAAGVPGTEWLLPEAKGGATRIPYFAQTPLEDSDLFDLEAVLEDIAPEIAAV